MLRILYGIAAFACVLLVWETPTQADSAVPIPKPKPDFSEFLKAKAVKNQTMEIAQELPKPKAFGRKDSSIYKEIFKAQNEGDFDKADALLKKVDSELLLGHVLYQRYMHPVSYTSSFEELKYWLDIYADHPGAKNIYRLANAKKPANFSGTIRKPELARDLGLGAKRAVDQAKRYKSDVKRSAAQNQLRRNVRKMLSDALREGPAQGKAVLAQKGHRDLFDKKEFADMQASVAARFFYRGDVKQARAIARQAYKTEPNNAPLASWIKGLTAWQAGDYKEASIAFQSAASSDYASGWMRAAGSFWTARSLMRAGDFKNVTAWLEKANEHPRTFYGLLAMRALGRDNDFNWKTPTFTQKYYRLVKSNAGGARALALVESGQYDLAEAELLKIDVKSHPNMQKALLAYADFADLPRLSMRLASRMQDQDDEHKRLFDAALYPKISWEPSNGYTVDPALMYAIMRQESKFDRFAKSPSGASGLMQIMPATAYYVAKQEDYPLKHKSELNDPQKNLDLGHLYVKRLLENNLVKGNVIKLLISYNAGPGNLMRWQKRIDHKDDPLLFVEMLPVAETRAYVERVLANYWMYRFRDGRDAPSLDSLAEGRWAFYDDDALESYNVAQKR